MLHCEELFTLLILLCDTDFCHTVGIGRRGVGSLFTSPSPEEATTKIERTTSQHLSQGTLAVKYMATQGILFALLTSLFVHFIHRQRNCATSVLA